MVKKIEITISGTGHEFQHHRLGAKMLNKILATYDKEGVDNVIETYFDGGKKFDEVVFNGEYGCEADCAIKVNGKTIKGIKKIQKQALTDSKPENSGADFYYLAHGTVTGTASIETTKEFDKSLLEIHYVSWSLLGSWQVGSVITEIIYDGNAVDIEWTDEGQELRHLLVAYAVDKKGNFDGDKSELIIMYSDDEDEWKFDRNSLLSRLS
jgi:hypothetical protein